MNYRHAFHAGNFADVVKHAVFAWCIQRLVQKDAPVRVIDTHAGVGAYDLASEEAQRNPEWKDGVARVWSSWRSASEEARRALQPWMSAVAAEASSSPPEGALTRYPGSPAVALSLLRGCDRLQLCELHPADAQTLNQRMRERQRGEARWTVEERDGFDALAAYLPPPERRGLVLVDPPFEAADELSTMERAARRAIIRWPTGVFLFWRPLKAIADVEAFDRGLASWLVRERGVDREKLLTIDLWVRPPGPGRLAGAGLFVVNPPFGLEDAMRAALPWLAERLGEGDGSGWRITRPEPGLGQV